MDDDRRSSTTYLIADVAALTGVPAPRLRSWERAGLLRPARSGGAVRVYPSSEVARARLIRRSLDNPGRRGSLRRLAERLGRGEIEPGPEDWAGLGGAPSTPSEVLPGVGWQAVVDALPAPVAIWDRDGGLAHANPSLALLLGGVGRVDAGPAVDALTASGALSPRWVARVGVGQDDVAVAVDTADGQRATVWRTVPLPGPDAAPGGAAALGRDATEAEARHRTLEGRLAAAAGEVRPRLGVVLGNLQLARRVVDAQGIDGRERLARHLRMAEAGAREVLRILDTVLDSTAAAGGGLLAGLEADDVDFAPVARDAVEHAAALTTRHALRLELPERPLPVVGDRARLREVLDNLLANAVAFSPDGGPIRLRATVEERAARPWVVLRVEDEGIGIPPDELPVIFERYRRGGAASGAVRGAGLGLYLARTLAAAHGGELVIERTAARATGPDAAAAAYAWHGTVVAFALPLRHPDPGGPGDRAPQEAP